MSAAFDEDGFPVSPSPTIIGPVDAVILVVGNRQPPLTIMNRAKTTLFQINQHPVQQVLTVGPVFLVET